MYAFQFGTHRHIFLQKFGKRGDFAGVGFRVLRLIGHTNRTSNRNVRNAVPKNVCDLFMLTITFSSIKNVVGCKISF